MYANRRTKCSIGLVQNKTTETPKPNRTSPPTRTGFAAVPRRSAALAHNLGEWRFHADIRKGANGGRPQMWPGRQPLTLAGHQSPANVGVNTGVA
jgi:hypothetical protein